jgi:hypothetical protein
VSAWVFLAVLHSMVPLVVPCSAVLCHAVLCRMMLFAVPCCAVLCCAVPCCAVPYDASRARSCLELRTECTALILGTQSLANAVSGMRSTTVEHAGGMTLKSCIASLWPQRHATRHTTPHLNQPSCACC